MASEYVSIWPTNSIFGKDFTHAGRESQQPVQVEGFPMGTVGGGGGGGGGGALFLQLPHRLK